MATRAALSWHSVWPYGRWEEAEEKLKETLPTIRTPSGYVQQSPWMPVANKQMVLMGKYMAELGLTPAARSRMVSSASPAVAVISAEPVTAITRMIVEPVRPPRDGAIDAEARAWVRKHCQSDTSA
jgi:P27 family predicted phage terminase small subunit